MKYLKYLGYAEQEVGFVAFDKASKWGLVIAGLATKELIKYMESGNTMLPKLRMTNIERVFSFGNNHTVSWQEMMNSLNDDEEGLNSDCSAKEFLDMTKKVKPSMLFEAIFERVK